MYKTCIIGLGEVGAEVYKTMRQMTPDEQIIGVDLPGPGLDALRDRLGGDIRSESPIGMDVYIYCIWDTKVAMELAAGSDPRALHVFEMTLDPRHVENIAQLIPNAIAFPHRFNPQDPEHHVFNLTRVMGGKTEALMRFVPFLRRYMDIEKYIVLAPDFESAAISKVIENVYRFWEIVLAQELHKDLSKIGIDLDEMRKLTNTKWNIEIRQAQGGVGGKCLPWAMEHYNAITNSMLGRLLNMLNEDFKRKMEIPQ